MTTNPNAHGPLHRQDVTGIVGVLDDDKVAAIIATGASVEDVAEAFVWVNAEDDVMGEVRKSLSGTVADVYDILTADDWDEER
jgi:hypothetical protein